MEKLSEQQAKLLCMLLEACAETQHQVGGMIRFSYGSHPADVRTQSPRLTSNLGKILAVLQLLHEDGLVERTTLDDMRDRQLNQLRMLIRAEEGT